jgi:glycine/D-amino acid oxidase-like deaminating enzyme
MTTAVGAQFARYDSVWCASFDVPVFPPLTQNLSTDVVVVGAGIAGMSVAYQLARSGRKVVVIDDGGLGGGITSRTTAHLTCAMDNSYTDVEQRRGSGNTTLAAQSHSAAIDEIERIAREESIDCDFERVDAYLFLPPGESIKTLEEELAAIRRAGLPVERLARAPLDFFDTGPCIHYPNQGRFHPLKYISGLARSIERDKGQIYCGTHVSAIEGGKTPHVQAGRWTVHAEAVVVATNSPVNDRVFIHMKQFPYTTYVIGARIPTGSVPPGLYWDMDDPYHYVRPHPVNGHDVLIIGGEDHKTGQADDTERRHARLEAWARRRGVPLGGPGDGFVRRSRLHRQEPGAAGQRVRGHGRHRHGHDARHHRRNADQ